MAKTEAAKGTTLPIPMEQGREIGKRYLFRTVPFFLAGRLIGEDSAEYRIDNVQEVYETGAYPGCLAGEKWSSADTLPPTTVVFVNKGATGTIIAL